MGQHRRTTEMVEQLVEALGPGPWPRADVIAAGWTPAQVRRAVEAGRLARPYRDVLALPAARAPPGAQGRGLWLSTHAMARLHIATGRAALSHESAAEWQGLWVPRRKDDLLHLTVEDGRDRREGDVRIHASALPEHMVTIVRGLRATTPARTAVDVARGRSLPDALISLDSACRRVRGAQATTSYLRTPEGREAARTSSLPELVHALDAQRRWPGSAVARTALDQVDPASESAFESWSRGWMVLDDLKPPAVGLRVVGASGQVRRSDFGWEDERVLGEADGFGKLGTDETSVRAALVRERRRQRDLEDAGWTVVRWDPKEPPRVWLARLRRELGRT